MSAPAGLCPFCFQAMQWSFVGEDMVVRCDECMDFFGIEVAHEDREGREAVMPDGRPCRSIGQIAKDSHNAICSS